MQSLGCVAFLCGNQKMAGEIFDFGMGSVKLFDGITKFAELFANPEAGLTAFSNPVSAFLTGACLLSKVFGVGRKRNQNGLGNMMAGFADALRFLSQQAHRYHLANMQRFDRLEKLFTSNHLVMLEQFFALHQTNEDFQLAFARFAQAAQHCDDLLMQSAEATNQLITQSHYSLSSNLQALRIEPITKLIQRISLEQQKEKGLPEQRTGLIDELFIEATTGAQGAYVTGSTIDIRNDHDIATALKQIPQSLANCYNHPAFSNINLPANVIGNRFNQPVKLVSNPVLWIKTTHALIAYIEEQLQKDPYFPATQIEQTSLIQKLTTLFQQGSDLVNVIAQMGSTAQLQNLFTDYKTALQVLSTAIANFQTSYEGQKKQEIVHELKKIHDAELFALGSNKVEPKTVVEQMQKGAYIITDQANPHKGKPQTLPTSQKTIFYRYHKNLPSIQWQVPNMPQFPNCEIIGSQVSADAIKKVVKDFNQKKEGIQLEISERAQQIMRAANYRLFRNPLIAHPLPESIYQVAHPANRQIYNIVLQLPNSVLLKPCFIAVQNNPQLGTITTEYEVEGAKLYIKSYLVNAHQKKLISNMSIDYPQLIFAMSDNCAKADYPPNEALWHFWYGGRYAKKGDELHTTHHTHRLFNSSTPYMYYAYANYPPLEPYVGVRDTFGAQATRVSIPGVDQIEAEVKRSIEQQLDEQQKEYNGKLSAEFSSSNQGRSLYTLLQKLDAQYKIVDAVCAIVYQENYTNAEPFQLFRTTHPELIKNAEAIIMFLEDYSANSDLVRSRKYIQDYIRTTSEKITQTAALIQPLLIPEFRDATTVLEQLTALIDHIQQRQLREPVVTQEVSLQQVREELRQRNVEMRELKMGQRETQTQLQSMAEQLAVMMALLKTLQVTKQ